MDGTNAGIQKTGELNAEAQKIDELNAESIKEGDVVELDATATYYDGRIIPAWVKEDKWIVSSVNGDRVVINRNVSGTHAIQSPIRRKYIKKVQ